MYISYRSIAKLLAKGMPVEGHEYSTIIEGYIKTIEAMPVERQAALQASYIFSRKVRPEECQDTFQDLVAHILSTLATNSIPSEEVELFCYAIAKRRWIDVIRKENRRKRLLNGGFISLNKRVSHSTKGGTCEEVELQELIAGEVEFERKLNSKLDCQAILDTLPDKVKVAVVKRSEGQALSSTERGTLHYYVKQNGDKIREAIKV